MGRICSGLNCGVLGLYQKNCGVLGGGMGFVSTRGIGVK